MGNKPSYEQDQIMPVPPKQALAAAARKAIELHDGWDKPHSFEILRWDENREHLITPHYTCIMTDINPVTQYAGLMISAVSGYLREHPDEPPYAFLLTYEEHLVELEAGSPRHARARAAMRAGRLGELPEARERAVSWCVDVHGRGWSAIRYRDRPETIEEQFWRPGMIPDTPELAGLVAVAYGTGMTQWGLPGPQQRFN